MQSTGKALIFLSFAVLISIGVCKSSFSARANFSQFEIEVLNAHNAYRRKHGVPPLKLDRNLCDVAQNWANHMAKDEDLNHSDSKYGENIYFSPENAPGIGKAAVDSWYSEIKSYNWSNPVFGMSTGHFTQVVWKSSKELGVAKAKGETWTYVVANYNPSGNYKGQFTANVPKPK